MSHAPFTEATDITSAGDTASGLEVREDIHLNDLDLRALDQSGGAGPGPDERHFEE